MTLSDFRTLIRAYVPAAKIQVISNAVLDLMINQGVKDINIKAAALVGNATFNVVAEQRDYTMSQQISDFIAFTDAGLWWNQGSASSLDWIRLTALTRRSLNDRYPQWANQDSDSPWRYIIEGDTLSIDPKPSASLTNGFWAFYIKKPTDMTQGSHYPFSGTTTEIASLSVFDDAIIDYVRWKLAGPLKAEATGILLEKDYDKSLASKIAIFKRRLDTTGNNSRMRVPTIGR